MIRITPFTLSLMLMIVSFVLNKITVKKLSTNRGIYVNRKNNQHNLLCKMNYITKFTFFTFFALMFLTLFA